MATRKKERRHLTGKSNRNFLFYNSDNENIYKCINSQNNGTVNKNVNATKNSIRENNNKAKNINEDKIKIEIAKAYSDEDSNILLKSQKNKLLQIKKNKNKILKFEVDKHERKVNDVSRLVELNKSRITKNNIDFKGSPCKFKPEGVKKIDINNVHKQETKIKKEKDINVDGLWDYLNTIQHSEDKRFQYKFYDIFDKRDKKMNWNENIEEENLSTTFKETLNKKEKISYNEYEDLVRYVLPSMAENKIKHSWNILKKNTNSEDNQVSCNSFFQFLNEQADTEDNKYTCKIVSSKLQQKLTKFNYNPDDVHLKTNNYVDNIRMRASEFSRNFKELVTEKELKRIFRDKDKINKKELEKCITDIIREKIQIRKEGKQNEKREDSVKEKKEEKEEKVKKTNIFNEVNIEGLKEFNMKAYISTLLSNRNDEVSTLSFINNLQVDYELLNMKNKNIKDAYDLYTRNISPTEKKEDSYGKELNEEEIKKAKQLIEEIDYNIRNNVKPLYVNTHKPNDNTSLSKYSIFKHIDTDKDSYITEDDLRKFMNSLKMKDLKDSDVNLVLKYMDSQKKGYVNINDFLQNYNIEEQSMKKWIRHTNKPYFDYINSLKEEKKNRKRCVSSHNKIENNKNAMNAKKFEDVINNYNLELDPCCTSYVIRERIREIFMARKEDFINRHLKATRFHITGYKNTNELTEAVKDSSLYIDDASRFKTTYGLNYT